MGEKERYAGHLILEEIGEPDKKKIETGEY